MMFPFTSTLSLRREFRKPFELSLPMRSLLLYNPPYALRAYG